MQVRTALVGAAHRPFRAAAAPLWAASTALWLSVAGPARIAAQPAEWRPLGPPGGTVLSLSPAPASAGTIWAGVEGAGLLGSGASVWKSIDGGSSWIRVPCPVSGLVVPLVADSVDPLTVFAGGAGGLLESADGGASWSVLHAGGNVAALAVAPSAPRVLYEIDDSPILPGVPRSAMSKSTDGGATWQPVALPLYGFETILLVVDPTDANRVYLSALGVSVDLFPIFYLTADGGATWMPAGALPTWAFVTALVVDPRHPATLYAGTYSSGGIFRSVDRGASWQAAGAGLPAGPVRSLALDPASGALLASIETGGSPLQFEIWKSVDDGATWARVLQGNGSVYALAVDAGLAGRVYAGGAGAGMLVSRDDGSHWQGANAGPRAVDVIDVAADAQAAGTLYIADSIAGLRKSTDGGGSWTPIAIYVGSSAVPVQITDFRRIVADPHTAGLVYAAVGEVALLQSTDAGQSWRVLGGPALHVEDLAVDPFQSSVLFAAGESTGPDIGTAAARSVDGGATWTPISGALGSTPDGAVANLDAVAFDPTSPGAVYIGGAGGLFATTDGGVTWTRVGQALPAGQLITRLRVDGGHVLYAVLAPGAHTLYRSADGGATWAAIDAGLPAGMAVRDLLLDPAGATLYAGTDAGVYRSPDGGAHWTAQSQGLDDARVNRLVMNPARPGVLYAATPGGLYVSPAPAAGPCIPTDTVLCLTGGRFAAQIAWQLGGGTTGSGHAVPLADGAGGFWFFSPASTETLLKIVDGSPVNGHFWVFAAGLSDVGYALTLTDTSTGAHHTYMHAPGTLASFADTGTFGGGHAGTRSSSAAAHARAGSSGRATASGSARCIPASDVLCVLDSRFEVRALWQLPGVASSPAFTVPLSRESGAFWFFGPESLELVVKVLDARALDGHFWIFTAGLSNVAYSVVVTDTATGSQGLYVNQAGELASRVHLF